MRDVLCSIPAALLLLNACCCLPAPDSDDTAAPETTVRETAEPIAAPTPSIVVQSVVFARELDEDWNPVGGAQTVVPADQGRVYARVELEGRPNTGTLKLLFMWRDEPIGETNLDLAEINADAASTEAGTTSIRAFLEATPLWIGDGNRFVIYRDEEEIGSYSFQVRPPDGAIASSATEPLLYRTFEDGELRDATTTFAPGDTIHVGGGATLGRFSWVSTRFNVAGTIRHDLSRTYVSTTDQPSARYMLNAHPDDGWPIGSHSVELLLDDRTVATLPFVVAAP